MLLGSATFVQMTAPGSLPVDPFFFLIGLTYALTIVYALTLRFVERYRWLVDLQLGVDALLVSAFIYFTGGITSYFSSLYVLPIVAASTVQFRRGGLLVATLSAVLYGGLVLAQYLAASGLLQRSLADRRRAVAAGRLGRALHRRAEPVRLLRGRAAQRLAGRRPALGRRPARAGVHRDRRSAGAQPARHRQPAERPGDDRRGAAHPDVQPRGRSDHRRAVPRRRRPRHRRRAAAAAGGDRASIQSDLRSKRRAPAS